MASTERTGFTEPERTSGTRQERDPAPTGGVAFLGEGVVYGNWELVREVGHGLTGKVWLAHAIGDRPGAGIFRGDSAALKFATNPDMEGRFARETALLAELLGHWTPKVYETQLNGAPWPWMAMEYVSSPSLRERVDRGDLFDEPTAEVFAEQLWKAIRFIDARGIAHRDISAGNVHADDRGMVRVIDLGNGKQEGSDDGLTTSGLPRTLLFAAPEVIENRVPIGIAADIWSWAALTLYAVTGRTLAPSAAAATVVCQPEFRPDLTGVPPTLLPALTAALSYDPAERSLDDVAGLTPWESAAHAEASLRTELDETHAALERAVIESTRLRAELTASMTAHVGADSEAERLRAELAEASDSHERSAKATERLLAARNKEIVRLNAQLADLGSVPSSEQPRPAFRLPIRPSSAPRRDEPRPVSRLLTTVPFGLLLAALIVGPALGSKRLTDTNPGLGLNSPTKLGWLLACTLWLLAGLLILSAGLLAGRNAPFSVWCASVASALCLTIGAVPLVAPFVSDSLGSGASWFEQSPVPIGTASSVGLPGRWTDLHEGDCFLELPNSAFADIVIVDCESSRATDKVLDESFCVDDAQLGDERHGACTVSLDEI